VDALELHFDVEVLHCQLLDCGRHGGVVCQWIDARRVPTQRRTLVCGAAGHCFLGKRAYPCDDGTTGAMATCGAVSACRLDDERIASKLARLTSGRVGWSGAGFAFGFVEG